MDQSAIKEIQNNRAMQSTEERLLNQQLPSVVLHKDYDLKSIEHLLPEPLRFRGTFRTTHPDSFAEYVCSEHHGENSTCFIDPDSMTAAVVIDMGCNEAPGHRDHQAQLHLQKRPEYAALCRIDGEKLSQKQMAEWLEDWIDYLDFAKTTGDDESAVINQKKVIAAIRSITIEQASKVQQDSQSLSERRTAMQSIEAKSDISDLPDIIMFSCKPYEGLPDQVAHLRLSITTGDRIGFTLRIKNHEAFQHQTAEHFMSAVSEGLEDAKDLRIYIGSFSK